MGDFYGYNPSQFVMPDRLGIGAASQVAANTVMNVSNAVSAKKAAEAKEAARQEKIRLAAEAFAKDEGAMDEGYTSSKKYLINEMNFLVENKAMTPQERDQLIEMYNMHKPNSVTKKNPMKYITDLNTTVTNIMGTLGEKKKTLRQGDVTGAVKSAMEGTPGTPLIPEQTTIQKETIPAGQWASVERPTRNAWDDEQTQTTPAVPATPAVPPSRNEQEAYLAAQNKLSVEGQAPATDKELEAGGIGYQRDLAKEELEKAKLALQEKARRQGASESQVDTMNDNYDRIVDQQNKLTDKLSKTRNSLKTIAGLETQLSKIKGGAIPPEALIALQELGMSPEKAALDPQAILKDLGEYKKALTITEKLQEEHAETYDNAFDEWIDSPLSPLPKLLKQGEITRYPDRGQGTFSSPPVLGGGGQITTRGKRKIGRFEVETE
jgi:hypothetical protein